MEFGSLIESNWFSPGWAPDNSRWQASLWTRGHRKEPHQGFAPGWALDHTGDRGTENLTKNGVRISFQRPFGREPLGPEIRWCAQSGKPPAIVRRPSGRKPMRRSRISIPYLWGLVLSVRGVPLTWSQHIGHSSGVFDLLPDHPRFRPVDKFFSFIVGK